MKKKCAETGVREGEARGFVTQEWLEGGMEWLCMGGRVFTPIPSLPLLHSMTLTKKGSCDEGVEEGMMVIFASIVNIFLFYIKYTSVCAKHTESLFQTFLAVKCDFINGFTTQKVT